MEEIWVPVKEFIFLSLFLVVAIVLKRKIGFLQRFLIPTSIIGGFIGLILGSEVLGWIQLDIDTLGNIIYHLMAVGFISVALKERPSVPVNHRRDNVNTGLAIMTSYLTQGIIGFILSLVMAYTFLPRLFPPFGLLLPLGFAQGPGQAYSIGTTWEEYGLLDGGNIGLFIATIGFLWAIIFGIPLLNILVRKKKQWGLEDRKKVIQLKMNDLEEKHTENIPKTMVLDSISVQVALIGTVYLITYLTLRGVSLALAPLGEYGAIVSDLLWGFHFVVATIFAILTRVILNGLKRKNWLRIKYPDNYILQRISAGSFDFMIVAAIAALSMATLKENWIPIVIITTAGGIFTLVYTVYLCRRIYDNYIIEHIVGLYGQFTGTVTTSMALLREIDPDSESNVPENLVLGGAVALPLGVPLMFIMGLAIKGHTSQNPLLYVYSLIIFSLYLAAILIYLMIRSRRMKTGGNPDTALRS
ncbi:MAG: sodium:glutamate symporter [Actinobacteria bacterium]|nr:sodium:glutamate symporter [Actinomycetota bacterium]